MLQQDVACLINTAGKLCRASRIGMHTADEPLMCCIDPGSIRLRGNIEQSGGFRDRHRVASLQFPLPPQPKGIRKERQEQNPAYAGTKDNCCAGKAKAVIISRNSCRPAI